MENKKILTHNNNKLFKRFCLILALVLNFNAASIAQSTYWWNDAVFYEVFVRSFKDNNGDGQGDLKGLIEKLDYLNDGNPATHTDLGVTAIWLMPIQQSPSYHGYDVTDYRTVEADYGSNQDFKDFMVAAHSRGIKVIIDYVMNHTSSQHPWFTNSVASLDNKRDWYVWQNPKPTNIGPWGQTVWHTKSAGNNYYGIFWSEMPDLNYNTPEVKTEMFDIARFWLEDMDVDGFRLDAVKYIDEDGTTLEDTPETIQFWKDFRTSYKSVNADAFAVGEAWTSTDKVAPYANNDGLDYCFEFDLATAIINVTNSGTAANVTALGTKINEVIATYPFLQYGTFLTNHDMNRVMSQFGGTVNKAKLGAHLLLTLPGVPYIYYGEEIGMTGTGVDENKRTPLQWNNTAQAGFTAGTPWRAVNADYTTKNIVSQQADAASIWNNYRKLIALRNNQAALRKGTYKSLTSTTTTVFSFLRQLEDENIVVVSNMSAAVASNVPLTLTNGGIAAGNYVLVELLGGAQLPVVVDNNGSFNLTITSMPGRATYIYKLLSAAEVSTSITLTVDMNAMITAGHFNPATETVNLVNDFGVSSTALSDGDGDGIYTLSVSSIDIGSKINYSYRINDTNDGREEASSREYVVLEGPNTVADIYKSQTVTSIEEVLKSGIAIYPVPANKELFIDFSAEFSGMVNYQLSDLVGEEKVSSSFMTNGHAGQYHLSCEGLAPGFYVLNVSYNGVKQAYRIVIQK
ncbi:MAG: alpha amylase catalytic region [Cytophagaceae bacterium]|jgi:glycosidase|nr:alpha amylase catalytic region [Cytophagaceae bacterium]